MLDAASSDAMTDPASSQNARRRDRSIRLAVAGSLVSKVGTVALQLLSIPLAVRVLGREEFGLYTVVNLTLGTMSLLEIGIGPALTHGLAKARAVGDGKGERELVSTAFFLMLAMALLVGAAAASLLSTVPPDRFFGSGFAGREAALRPALWTGLVLFLGFFVVNLAERIREGYLEVAVNHLWGAGGNFAAALFVGAGIWFVPEVWFLVLAVHGTMVAAKAGNLLHCWREHPNSRPEVSSVRPGMVKGLLSDGVSFSTCFLLTGFVEANFCGWLIGRYGGGPDAVALWGVFMTLTVMQLGFVVMLSTPTWPAVAEALARDETMWAKQAARRLYLHGMAFAVVSATGLVVLGPWGLGVWLGDSFSGTGRWVLAGYAFYFVVHVWRHLNHALMIGVGEVRRLARIQVVESSLMAGAVTIAVSAGNIAIMLWTMSAVAVIITGWMLPRQVRRALDGK